MTLDEILDDYVPASDVLMSDIMAALEAARKRRSNPKGYYGCDGDGDIDLARLYRKFGDHLLRVVKAALEVDRLVCDQYPNGFVDPTEAGMRCPECGALEENGHDDYCLAGYAAKVYAAIHDTEQGGDDE